jgi:TRAP-type C4-dicarboxylate transport system permease small subunit
MRRCVYRVAQAGAWVSGVIVVILMFLTAADVFMRYVVGRPIRGAMDVSVLVLVLLGFLAFGYTQLARAHIIIEVVTSRLSMHTNAVLAAITRFLSIVVYGLMVWGLTTRAWKYMLAPDIAPKSEILYIPHVPFMFVAAIGILILCLVLIVDFSDSITEVMGKEGGSK